MNKRRAQIFTIVLFLVTVVLSVDVYSFPPGMKQIWNHDGPIMAAGWREIPLAKLPAPYLKIVKKESEKGTAYKLDLGSQRVLYVFRCGRVDDYPVEYLIVGLENLKTKKLSDAYAYTENKEDGRGPNMGILLTEDNTASARQLLVIDLFQQPGSGLGGVTEQFYAISPKPALVRCFVLPVDEWNWFPKDGKDMYIRVKRRVVALNSKQIQVSVKVLEGFDYPLKEKQKKSIVYSYDRADSIYKPPQSIRPYPVITITSGSYREIFLQGGIGTQGPAGLVKWTPPDEEISSDRAVLPVATRLYP